MTMRRLTANLILALTALPLAAQEPNLPDFGSPADAIINKNQEEQLGRQVVAQMRNAGGILEDPQLQEYITSIGAQLVGQANDGSQNFQFFVVDDGAINAFALPGGFIGINAGLILTSESESELAGVLAHEIAHVTQRHIARSIYDNQRTSILSMATMLAAVLLGAAADVSGNAMTGLITASQAAQIQRQINFTRSNEHEADRVGIETLSAAGFDTRGMATFFEKLSRRYGMAREQIPALLQTHPVTSARIAEARERSRLLPAATHSNSMGYGVAKARLTIQQARSVSNARDIFANRLEQGNGDFSDRYGLALCQASLGLIDEADRTLTALVDEYPSIIAFWIARAETLMLAGFVEAAIDIYVEANDLFPRNVPLAISFAESLINAGQPARAHALLLDLLNNVPPTPEQIRLIARAANAEGDVGNAYYYMGEYYLSVGNPALAITQLRMALEAPGVNNVDRARYDARLGQIVNAMPADQRRRMEQAGDGPRPQ